MFLKLETYHKIRLAALCQLLEVRILPQTYYYASERPVAMLKLAAFAAFRLHPSGSSLQSCLWAQRVKLLLQWSESVWRTCLVEVGLLHSALCCKDVPYGSPVR